MDNLSTILIAIVPSILTYLGTKYVSQGERENNTNAAWEKLYNNMKESMDERLDDLQSQLEEVKAQMEEMKIVHTKEVSELKQQNKELKEENRQLRVENANYKNRLIKLGDEV